MTDPDFLQIEPQFIPELRAQILACVEIEKHTTMLLDGRPPSCWWIRLRGSGVWVVLKAVLSSEDTQRKGLISRERENITDLADCEGLNIPRLYALGIEDENYLALQAIVGLDMENFLRSNPTLSLNWLVPFIVQLVAQVQILHLQNKVHLDIKPSNIMISPVFSSHDELAAITQGKDVPVLSPQITLHALTTNFKLSLIDLALTTSIFSESYGLPLGTPLFRHPDLNGGQSLYIDVGFDIYSIARTVIYIMDKCEKLVPGQQAQLQELYQFFQRIVGELGVQGGLETLRKNVLNITNTET